MEMWLLVTQLRSTMCRTVLRDPGSRGRMPQKCHKWHNKNNTLERSLDSSRVGAALTTPSAAPQLASYTTKSDRIDFR